MQGFKTWYDIPILYMKKNFYHHIRQLLPPKLRKRMHRVLLASILRALLDFMGIAVLFPALWVILKPGEHSLSPLLLCGVAFLFVSLKNLLAMWLIRIQIRFQLDSYRAISLQLFVNHFRRGILHLKNQGSNRLTHEVNYTCYLFGQGILASFFRFCSEGILSLLLLTVLLVQEPIAGLLLATLFASLSVAYSHLSRKHLHKYGREELEARRKQTRIVSETFRGYPEIEISQTFAQSLHSFEQGAETIAYNRLRADMYQQFPLFISETALILGMATLTLAGRGDLSLSGGIFALVSFRLIPAIRMLLGAYATLQNTAHILDTIHKGLTFQSPDPTNPAPLDFRRQIKIRDLSYAFPDGHLLFRRINWTITPGERVGIRGTNGSGKTTLFNLLLGFLEPTEGEIRIDGQKLTLSNRADWHRIVGYVPQEIFIADETLLYNIAFGLPNPDREKARNVLKEVDLADWLDTLPAGLDTPMLETGSRLSGGQKQRIGIARALYKEPRVLLLDEASSALDPHTEQEINRSLLHLCEQHRELTLLIISHHEAPLALCNRILDLDNYRP